MMFCRVFTTVFFFTTGFFYKELYYSVVTDRCVSLEVCHPKGYNPDTPYRDRSRSRSKAFVLYGHYLIK